MIKDLKPLNNKFILIKRFTYLLKTIINIFLKKLNIFLIWRSGKAIGDQVLIAGFAKCLKSKKNCSIIVITKYPKLLSLSPWIDRVLSPDKIPFWYLIYYGLKLTEGERIIEYNFPYKNFGYNSHIEAYQSGLYQYLNEPPIWHAHVADRFGKELFENFSGGLEESKDKVVTQIIKSIRNKNAEFKIGIINPIGKATFTKAKIYGFKNYQRIINLTNSKILWIQVGLQNDQVLQNIHKDLRGKSLEFLVNIISLSDLVLADEGLMNHIAGSFSNVNSYVTFSEFSPPKYYSYSNTITLGEPDNLNKRNNWSYSKNNNFIVPNSTELAESLLRYEFD